MSAWTPGNGIEAAIEDEPAELAAARPTVSELPLSREPAGPLAAGPGGLRTAESSGGETGGVRPCCRRVRSGREKRSLV